MNVVASVALNLEVLTTLEAYEGHEFCKVNKTPFLGNAM